MRWEREREKKVKEENDVLNVAVGGKQDEWLWEQDVEMAWDGMVWYDVIWCGADNFNSTLLKW